MDWKDSRRGTLPEHNQEVLLSVNGVYFLTIFDSEHRIFKLKDGVGTHFEPDEGVYWLDIVAPPVSKSKYDY